TVRMGNGDGTFGPAATYPTGNGPEFIRIGDVNGDGHPDLATANFNSNDATVLINNGNGTFKPPLSFPAGARPISLAMGDVSGDGRMDLVVANTTGGNVSVLLNNGPSIGFTQQPVNRSISAGQNTLFFAAVTGGSVGAQLTLQWRRNGIPISNGAHYLGADQPILNVVNVTTAEVGAYDLQVTGGCNPNAVAYSRPASLSVTGCKGDFNNDGQF